MCENKVDRDSVEYKEIKIEIELRLAEIKKSLEIVKKMKKKDMDADTIKEMKGLTKWEIRKL